MQKLTKSSVTSIALGAIFAIVLIVWQARVGSGRTGTCESMESPHFTTLAGNWANYGGLAEFKRAAQRESGFSVSDSEMKRGSVEATIRVPGFKLGCKAHLVYGLTPDLRTYITAGLGGDRAAYSVGEYNPQRGWRSLASGGDERMLMANNNYTVKLSIGEAQSILEINGVPVIRLSRGMRRLPQKVGIWTEGCDSAEFICFKTCPD
ncbi:MAG TPA: hypothetical protein VGS07_01300 [Thermoanaerobaculia bacterium]|nr:hypothetical protein [Thermoanaerobaculia bacterium]